MNKFFNTCKLTDEENRYLDNLPKYFDNGAESALFAGFPFLENADEIKTIKGLLVFVGGVIVFYNQECDKEVYKRYVIQQLLRSPKISEKINYNFDSFIFFHQICSDYPSSEFSNKFDSDDIRIIVSIFQKINSLTKKEKRDIKNNRSLGSFIVERSKAEANFDEEQFKFIFSDEYNDVNIKVSGLAGCGKTILLSEKMAYLHFKYPDKRIGYIFYTKSLKQSIDNFFQRFYAQIVESNIPPKKDNIFIMHGWGSYQYPGLYSTICDWLGISNTNYNDFPDFSTLCDNLIKSIVDSDRQDQIREFDYILIDEAQDFSLSFFKLAKMCLKPNGKLIYAYDELQALNEINKKMPTKEDIFGSDEICKDVNLSKCYRTPKEILVTAHALGLGIYHYNSKGEREFVNAISSKEVWKSIGYQSIPLNFKAGDDVIFRRETVIPNYIGDDVIVCKDFKAYESQTEYVIKEITNLIQNEEVIPDDILIIDLDARNINYNYSFFVDYLYSMYNLSDDDSALPFDVSIINKESGNSFRIKNRVTYTTIFRAKGNESNIVFILNSNNSDTLLSYNRNRLFTAMTRAKLKVYICGIGQDFIDTISKEIEIVKHNGYRLIFKYPTREEILKCYRRVGEDNRTNEKVDEAFRLLGDSKNGNIREEFIRTFFNRLSKVERDKILNYISSEKDEKR